MTMNRSELTKRLPGEDILFAYKKRIWSLLAAVCVIVFLPGSIFIFFNGFRLLAVAVIVMLGVFALHGYSIIQGKAPRLTMSMFVACLCLVIGLSIIQRGPVGVFWAFPGVLLISFLSFGLAARIYTAVYFVCVSSIMLSTLDLEVSTRAVTGLLVTILIESAIKSGLIRCNPIHMAKSEIWKQIRRAE